MIFDGKAFAKTIEDEASYKVRNFVKKPKIVSVLVGNDTASELYTKLKKSAAERVGIQFDVIKLEISNNQTPIIKQKVAEIGAREDVTGVMVQLPVPGLQGQALKEVLSAIPLDKDVDGLRWEKSGVMPATVRAVMSILENISNRKVPNSGPESSEPLGAGLWARKFVVVGARGAVGRPLVYFLRKRGVEVVEVEWDTPDPFDLVAQGEVVISCVGKAGIVIGEMVRDGVVAIDVGMSEMEGKVVGDMAREVYEKASVAVPVPGGVGPVTVVSLMMNGLEITYARNKDQRV